jgi:hypothetical protein
MRGGETAKDVARRIIGQKVDDISRKELQRITDQVRYWAKIDALTPSAPAPGTGHWKTFDEANVYTAAVLFEVSKYAPRWGFLTKVGQYLWAGVRDQIFYIDPDDPNSERIRHLEEENKKLSMIKAARDGEANIYLGASSPSTWDVTSKGNKSSQIAGDDEEITSRGPAKFLISELSSVDDEKNPQSKRSTSNGSKHENKRNFPQVTAAEIHSAAKGRILVTKGAPTPPPMTSMIVVNLSEIFAMVRRSYEDRPLKQNSAEQD